MHDYNNYGYPNMSEDLYDDHPDLTEIRQVKPMDISLLESIDLKCQETPMVREGLQEIMKEEEVHGILATRKYQPCGFALFNIQDNGRVVFINRFSVAQLFLERGVPEKMIESLRMTLVSGPKATLRMVVSENDIGSPMFDKLLTLGFRATGLIKGNFLEYSRVWGTDKLCDGIKLELE